MKKIGIYCLGYRRPEFFIAHARELAKCRYDDFHFYVLTNGISDDYAKSIAEILKDKVSIYQFPDNAYNYMSKIHFAVREEQGIHEFCIKHDEDCFMLSESWDRLFQLADKMEENDLAVTGAISNGIPTTELFIENHTPEIKEELFSGFCKIKLGVVPVNYGSLDEDYTEWVPEKFYSKVKNFNHYYKGIHPVRVNFDSVKKINDYIIANFKSVMLPKNTELIRDNTKYPYFCNSMFMIRTSEWRQIINDKSLYVDPFDEVPLNRYRDKHNKNLLIDTGIPIIHTMYNWTPNWDYEKDLISKIVQKAGKQ